MSTTTNKLSGLTLVPMVLINSIAIISFMAINSLICEDGLSGGECVKHLDNRVFLFQIATNILFALYYLLKVDKNKWGVLILNSLLSAMIYIILATLHSISKAGIF